jgi:ATP-dependent Clp protease ATP-binding subunit ClpC
MTYAAGQRFAYEVPVARRDDFFTVDARNALTVAEASTREHGHRFIGPEHLLLGLLSNPEDEATRALAEVGITADMAEAYVDRKHVIGGPYAEIGMRPAAKQAIKLAVEALRGPDDRAVETRHLLGGLAFTHHEELFERLFSDRDTAREMRVAVLSRLGWTPTSKITVRLATICSDGKPFWKKLFKR